MLCASCERWCQVTAPRQNVHRPITGPRGTLAPRRSTHVRPPDPAEVCRVPASRGPFPGCRPRRTRGADSEWRQTHARGGFPSTLGGGTPHRTGSVAREGEPLERSDNGVGGCRCARAEWRWCGGRSGRDAQRDQRTRQRSRRTWRARWARRAGPRSVPWTGPASGTGSTSRPKPDSRPRSAPGPATSCTQPLTLANGRTDGPQTRLKCGGDRATCARTAACQPRAANSPSGIDNTTRALNSASTIVVRSRSLASRLSSRRRPTYAVMAPTPSNSFPRRPELPTRDVTSCHRPSDTCRDRQSPIAAYPNVRAPDPRRR